MPSTITTETTTKPQKPRKSAVRTAQPLHAVQIARRQSAGIAAELQIHGHRDQCQLGDRGMGALDPLGHCAGHNHGQQG